MGPRHHMRNLLSRTAILLVGLLVAGAALAAPVEAKKKNDDPSFFVIQQQKGKLACAAGAAVVATDELCAGIDPSSKSKHAFSIPADADAVLVEMAWIPSSAFGASTLALTLPTHLGTHGAEGEQRVEGKSILRALVKGPPGGSTSEATVGVRSGAATSSGLVLEQVYELRVTSFHNMAIPDGYSAFS